MAAPKCNSNINGQWYYTSIGGTLGNFIGAGMETGMACSSSCMCFIFALISMSLSQGEPSAGVYIVYACTVSWLLSAIGMLIRAQMHKAAAKAESKKPSRPCVDPTGAVLPVETTGAVLPVKERKPVKP